MNDFVFRKQQQPDSLFQRRRGGIPSPSQRWRGWGRAEPGDGTVTKTVSPSWSPPDTVPAPLLQNLKKYHLILIYFMYEAWGFIWLGCTDQWSWGAYPAPSGSGSGRRTSARGCALKSSLWRLEHTNPPQSQPARSEGNNKSHHVLPNMWTCSRLVWKTGILPAISLLSSYLVSERQSAVDV